MKAADARLIVSTRENQRCALADVYLREGEYSYHHRQLRSRMGKDSPANLVLLSGSGTTGAHGWVHAHPADATRLGLMVPSHEEPSEWPIWRRDAVGGPFGWHLQLHDGQLCPMTWEAAAAVMRDLFPEQPWRLLADAAMAAA